MLYFIEVVLPLAVSKTFTYQVSEAEFNYIQVGMRVAVPFGKTKMYTALVLDKNNIYDVRVMVADSKGATDTQTLSVNVTNINDNVPNITSNGGGSSASISIGLGSNKAEMRKWEIESALSTLKRADEIRKDAKMMTDVKKLAQEQMNVLSSFTKK